METNKDNLKIKLNDKAPDFKLPGTDGKAYTLNDFKGKTVLVVIFMCNHCPYVKGSLDRIKQMQSDFGIKGLQIIGINSNDQVNYPDDSFEKMIETAKEKKMNFVYLRDEDQAVANLYGAQATPECFVFDEHRKLVYHGRVDDSPRDPNNVKTEDLKNAIDAAIHSRKVSVPLTPAIGCSIKWK